MASAMALDKFKREYIFLWRYNTVITTVDGIHLFNKKQLWSRHQLFSAPLTSVSSEDCACAYILPALVFPTEL